MRQTKRNEQAMPIITDTDRRLLYAAICSGGKTPTEIAYESTSEPAHVRDVLADAIAAGWVIRSQRGATVLYRATHMPACCRGGFIPPTPEQSICIKAREKHMRCDLKRPQRKSRAKRMAQVEAA